MAVRWRNSPKPESSKRWVWFRLVIGVFVVTAAARLILALLENRDSWGGNPSAQGALIGLLLSAIVIPAALWITYIPTFLRKRRVMKVRPNAIVIASVAPGAGLEKSLRELGAVPDSRGTYGTRFTVSIEPQRVSFWRGSGESLVEFLRLPASEISDVKMLEGLYWTGRKGRFCVLIGQRDERDYELWLALNSEARGAAFPEPRHRLQEIVGQIHSILVTER